MREKTGRIRVGGCKKVRKRAALCCARDEEESVERKLERAQVVARREENVEGVKEKRRGGKEGREARRVYLRSGRVRSGG